MNAGLPEPTQHWSPPIQPATPPPARRLQKIRLVNTKFVIGAILVTLAIAGGALVVSTADSTESVWALRTALPRGTQLGPEDVVLVNALLPDSKGRYLRAGESVVGKTLNRDIGEGELVPAAALRKSACGSLVTIPVAPRHLPSTLRRGAHIDVYATLEVSDKSQNKTEPILSGAMVQYVNAPGGGALATSGEWAVGIRVSKGSAEKVISAVRGKVVDVAMVDSAGSDGDPCPPQSPEKQKSSDTHVSSAPQGS